MDIHQFSSYEWILSNRNGSYALGASNLLNHRKYHGILIAGTPDFKRRHLVSSIEENLLTEDGISFSLDNHNYPNVIYPQGYKHIVKYFLRPYPAFLYSSTLSSQKMLILKTIQLHPTTNAAIVRYKNLGEIVFQLTLRPKITLRDHHLVHTPGYWDIVGYSCDQLEKGVAKIKTDEMEDLEVFLSSLKGDLNFEPVIYRNVIYPSEILRGYEGAEDLLAPWVITTNLNPQE